MTKTTTENTKRSKPAVGASSPVRSTDVITETGAEGTFVEQFRVRSGRLSANGHSWLAPMREAAIERFERLGLPTMRDEGWRKTNLSPLRRTAFIPVDDPDVPALSPWQVERLEELSYDELATHRMVFLDGRFVPEHSHVGTLPEGVTVARLADALEENPDALEADLGQIAPWGEDAFAALNTAFFRDGAYVHVPANTRVDEPIHLVFLSSTPDGETRAAQYPRNLIRLEEHAHVTVVETYSGLDDTSEYLSVPVTEAVLFEGAHLDHYKRQQESEKAFHVGRVYGRQADHSHFSNHNVALGGRIARNDIAVDIGGTKCETTLMGLYMGRDSQHIDNYTRLDHARPDCHSHERYKGILDDRATAVFTGSIMVHQDAQLTDAIQENNCLLLSDDARINTQPQLEIFADDVKCTHGATVGELPDEHIFYLRTRGIPPVEAHGILTFAYANEIIDGIAIEPLRVQLESLIRQRVRESHRRS